MDPDPDTAFQVKGDSESISVSGSESGSRVLVTKNATENLYSLFLNQKLQFTYPLAFPKDVQATGEAFSPQKRTSDTSKHEILLTFFNISGSFLPSWIRIQFGSEYESGSTTLLIGILGTWVLLTYRTGLRSDNKKCVPNGTWNC